jgi:hypothetical protein
MKENEYSSDICNFIGTRGSLESLEVRSFVGCTGTPKFHHLLLLYFFKRSSSCRNLAEISAIFNALVNITAPIKHLMQPQKY